MRRWFPISGLLLVLAALPPLSLAASAAPPEGAGPVGAPAARASACSPVTTPAHFTGTVPTPKKVLGFPVGQREATGREIMRYWHAVDQASDRVVTGTFATSYQQRPLPYALVGSPATLSRLPAIRADIQRLRNPSTPDSAAAEIARRTPAILWITANVHGNEPSGADAVLKLLHHLAGRDDCVAQAILDNALVGLIPTQNPDGRANNRRTNAFAFDMNRDWFAQTQPETSGKLDLLWRYPPQLYVDEHENGGNGYFFPPNSDPIYHETPDAAYAQISKLYGHANEAAFQAKGWKYETFQAGYDLFYQGYGDTVPTTQFGAAGMTFEQGEESPYPAKTAHHFLSALVSLYTGATHRQQLLDRWRQSFVQAQDEGAACRLEPNATFNPGNQVLLPVPRRAVCGYFLADSPETRLVIRRLQLAHVEVAQLTAPLDVPDYRAYGQEPTPTTLPAGTFWITMDQSQKHWVQAMLNEDTYVPFPYFYDVSGWSNPLLAGVAGGSTGLHLAAATARVPRQAHPAPPTLPGPTPRIGVLDQRPEPTYEYSTTGWLRWRLSEDWNLPYTTLDPTTINAASLSRLDVLLVPDVDSVTYDLLGDAGRGALREWVANGGRFVGWQGGTVLAGALGLSSATLDTAAATSPGALLSVSAPHPDTYALWEDYDGVMDAHRAATIASFASPVFVSGYADGAQSLAGSPVEAVDRIGSGSVTVFSVEPNFRAYTDATARLLFDAIGGTPATSLTGSRPPGPLAPDLLAGGQTAAEHIAREERGKS